MYSRALLSRIVTFSAMGLVICVCTNALAKAPKFKPGDKVEVQVGFDWKPAVVVSVDNFSGWVEARVDNGPGRSNRGKDSFPPSYVRASKQPKPRPVADAPVRKWTDRSGKFSIDA